MFFIFSLKYFTQNIQSGLNGQLSSLFSFFWIILYVFVYVGGVCFSQSYSFRTFVGIAFLSIKIQ